MPTERTPLTSATARSPRRLSLAKLAVGAVLLGALGAVFYASQDHNNSTHNSDSSNSGASPADWDWFCGEQNVEADFIRLSNKQDDHYFYWFVASRNSNKTHNNNSDPLVVWLNGGPGSSSLEGLLTENGPCLVEPHDLSLARNQYAWNNAANVIWLEQPSGVGFSYFGEDGDNRDATGEDVGANMVAFLDGFLDKHPELDDGRAVFLTGESYAGHYIPAMASAIHSKNKQLQANGQKKRIHLQGLAIGNGDPNLVLQYTYSATMAIDNAYNLTLLNATQLTQMQQDAQRCSELLATCERPSSSSSSSSSRGRGSCSQATAFCDDSQLGAFLPAMRNVYDMRQPCATEEQCYDTDGGVLETFLAEEKVQKALFGPTTRKQWNAQVGYVNEAFVASGDWARVYTKEIQELLDADIRMLIYAGDADLVCNWIGNKAWTLAQPWHGQRGFQEAQDEHFVVPAVDGTSDSVEMVAGELRRFANLAFVRVFNAGHLVPKNQPMVSWVMIDRFLKNEPL